MTDDTRGQTAADWCAVGVDIGGQSVKLGLVDGKGEIHHRRQVPIASDIAVDAMVELLGSEVAAVCKQGIASGRTAEAVGMVMPGYMNRDRTRLLFAANLPNLNDNDFLERVRGRLDLPVIFDADSNAATFAEYTLGAGRGARRLIVAAIGTGIGAAVVIDGEILRIFHHVAGSLGHMLVDPTGPRCRCGARGCVEAMAAGPAIEAHAGELADQHGDSVLARLREQHGRLTGTEIAEALQAGDDAAKEVIRRAGYWLGISVTQWAVIFAPEIILIGGGVAAFGEPYFKAIREAVREHGQPRVTDGLRIEAAALGPNAGLIGAAALAICNRRT